MNNRRGATNHIQGLLAEDAVERVYLQRGFDLVEKRWRARLPEARFEIDLIFEDSSSTVFCEVKAARTWDRAAAAFGPRQQARVQMATQLYLDHKGLSSDRDVRFDLALVDIHGKVEIRENILI